MDEKRSTRRIGEVVRAWTPDVVCFQEIHQRLPWSGREDQPALLSQVLGRPFVFQRNLRIGFGGYGLGIASRATIVERKEHFLPSGKEQRGALEVRLHNAGNLRSVSVFCTHWGLKDEERMKQAEALAALVLAAPRPVILCGDFNEDREGAALGHLLRATGLKDADELQNRATFVSNNPTVRIDYVLYSEELVLRECEVIASLASDHLPVSVDFDPAG